MALFLRSKMGTVAYKRNGQKYVYLGTGMYPSQDHVFARPGNPKDHEPFVVSEAYPDTQQGLAIMKRTFRQIKIVQMNPEPTKLQQGMLIKLQQIGYQTFRTAQMDSLFNDMHDGVRKSTFRALIRKGFVGRDYAYDEDEGTLHGMVFFLTNKGHNYRVS